MRVHRRLTMCHCGARGDCNMVSFFIVSADRRAWPSTSAARMNCRQLLRTIQEALAPVLGDLFRVLSGRVLHGCET